MLSCLSCHFHLDRKGGILSYAAFIMERPEGAGKYLDLTLTPWKRVTFSATAQLAIDRYEIQVYEVGSQAMVRNDNSKYFKLGFREETKGRLRKRAVLANVPSFRFLVPGSICMYRRSGFWCWGTSECTPRPGSRHRGTSAKTTPPGNHPFANPRGLHLEKFPRKWFLLGRHACGTKLPPKKN